MYRFRHILFQKYLYGRMDEVERTYLHEEAGTALEALYGEHVDEVALQLARHFREAGITDKAIGYLQQAGRKAVQLSANAEAIAHFRDALALVGDLTDTDGRPRAELELQLLLGAPLLATAGPGSADLYLAYSRALELCEQVGDAPQLFQALFLLVHHHANTGGLPAALELATRLVELAESAEEPLPTVMAYWARGFVLHFLGRYEEAARDHERVVDLYDADQHASLAYVFGMDPGVSALTMNGVAYWHLGHPDRARSWCDRGIALAERVGHPSSLAHALTISTSCSLNRGDVASLTEHVEKLVRVSTEKGAVLFAACGVFYEGRLLIERGRSAEGLARMHEGSDAIEQAGSRLARAEILALLAEAHGRANDPAAGLELIDDALAHTEADHDRNFEPGLHALRGELLLQTGQSAKQAEASFRRALEIARARSLKSWELRAAMGLARLSPSVGSADEARELLAGVFGWFTEGFETRDLRAAAKLLDELS
jgi:tetratricopeptide (TPR) repeat protein